MRLIPTLPLAGTGVWTASTFVAAAPPLVLDALTDPDLIARWAPVGFDVEQLDGERLRAGDSARIAGAFAGIGAAFEVDVLRADEQRFELRARGPLVFDVAYSLRDGGDGVFVDARVELRARPGVSAQLLAAATRALLNAGALAGALTRLRAALAHERELVAA